MTATTMLQQHIVHLQIDTLKCLQRDILTLLLDNRLLLLDMMSTLVEVVDREAQIDRLDRSDRPSHKEGNKVVDMQILLPTGRDILVGMMTSLVN